MDFSQIIKEQREELEEIEQRERIIGREGLEKTKEFLKIQMGFISGGFVPDFQT